MKKIATLLILIFTTVRIGFAQDTTDFFNKEEAKKSAPKPPYNLRDHLFTGGNFGLQIGTITLIDVSPLIGYKVTKRFSLALGVSYIYYKDNRTPPYTQSIYGGRLVSRYFIFDNLFIHGELEALNSKWDYYKKPFTIYNVLGGAGYRQAISDRLFFDAMLLWNFTPTLYNPYVNPIIRIGFNLGL